MVSSFSYITNKEKRRRFWEFIKVTAAHHPHCEYYKDHVFTFRNIKICRGCSVYYPTSLISIILIWFVPTSLFERTAFELSVMGIITVIPAGIHFLKIDKKFRIDRKFSIFSKFSLGVGFGYFVRYLFHVPLGYAILGSLFAVFLIIGINLSRLLTFWDECRECPYNEQRQLQNTCPGLDPFNSVLNPDFTTNFNVISDPV